MFFNPVYAVSSLAILGWSLLAGLDRYPFASPRDSPVHVRELYSDLIAHFCGQAIHRHRCLYYPVTVPAVIFRL